MFVDILVPVFQYAHRAPITSKAIRPIIFRLIKCMIILTGESVLMYRMVKKRQMSFHFVCIYYDYDAIAIVSIFGWLSFI